MIINNLYSSLNDPNQTRTGTQNVGMFVAKGFGLNRNVDMFVANWDVWLCEIKTFKF